METDFFFNPRKEEVCKEWAETLPANLCIV